MTANAGYHTYATGDVLTAAQVQYNLQNQTVMYFATTTARDAALTGAILVEGLVTYTPATKMMYYNGSAWVAVAGAASPLTTKGDVYGFDTAGARIPIGTNNQVLTADSTQALGLKWATPATSPLTTKGDLFGYDTANARLPVGTNNQVLTADSAQTLGVKWATPSGATKSYSLLSTTSLTAASTITVSSLGGYDDFLFLISSWECGTASSQLSMVFNSDTASNYQAGGFQTASSATYDRQMIQAMTGASWTAVYLGKLGTVTGSGLNGAASVRISGANSTGFKAFTALSGTLQDATTSTMSRTNNSQGIWANAAQLTSVSVTSSAGNFTAGTIKIYAAV